jgi:hypothetical protein
MTPDATTNGSPPLASGTGYAITSYSFNGQVFGDLCIVPRIPTTFRDGMSNTLLACERYAICGQGGEVRTWGDGAGDSGNAECVYLTASTDTPKIPSVQWVTRNVTSTFKVQPTGAGCNTSGAGSLAARANSATPHNTMAVLMGDGSVRSGSGGMSLATWQALITPAGGDIPGSDW